MSSFWTFCFVTTSYINSKNTDDGVHRILEILNTEFLIFIKKFDVTQTKQVLLNIQIMMITSGQIDAEKVGWTLTSAFLV